MDIISKSKQVRVSPRKMRLIADLVRGMSAVAALERLDYLAKSGARPMLKAIKSAVANASNNHKLQVEVLKVKNVTIDEGLKMKRRDTSHGARYGGGMITKKASHITVILEGTS